MTVLVAYTTLYREGGPKFRRVARTLAAEKRAALPGVRVVDVAVESKAELVAAIRQIAARGERIDELHFVGHSGMYGPMFRTTEVPEQLSPHEWRTLDIPFADGAAAYFHACRSARWFCPFFARTFGVPAYGYHLYTTFSRSPRRFVWDPPHASDDAALYVVALPGRKSHGLGASILKYAHVLPVEPMTRYEPDEAPVDGSYDKVADLYDEAFADIAVRGPEVDWIERHMPFSRAPRVLEIGTGNGALLARLSPRIASGHGVDASEAMIARAERRFGHLSNVTFGTIAGPSLPVPDASVDVVVSMLSFRYLDWDPIMAEIRRVLAPGGRILVVDMVASPVTSSDAPALVASTLRGLRERGRKKAFREKLRRLVRDPAWATMLKHNPIRAEHEYRWYFEGRFPGRKLEVIDVALASRIVAFDTGPLPRGFTLPQSYP